MNVLMLSGSRNPDGQTARALAALAEGLREGGADVETVFLPERRIERCRPCDAQGWGLCRSEGRCVIEDDFADLATALKAADTAVFATPVYYSDLAESLRAFLDRLRRTSMHPVGKAGLEGTPAVGVCVAGGGGGGAPACTVSLEKIVTRCGFDLVDMVPVRRQNLAFKTGVLRDTGRWLAAGAREDA